MITAPSGKMIAPVVEEYAQAFPGVKFYKVDIDKDSVSRSVAAANVSAVVSPLRSLASPLED